MGEAMTYTVRRGDTLYDIARRFSVSISQLLNWNGLSKHDAADARPAARDVRQRPTLRTMVPAPDCMYGRRSAGCNRAASQPLGYNPSHPHIGSPLMGFLTGKRALIVGLATDRSIAHGIAQAMHREGAELAFTYVERLKDRVVHLAGELGSKLVDADECGVRRRNQPRVRRPQATLGQRRHHRARRRFRAARSTGRRFRRQHFARRVSRRARYFELQPDRSGARRRS